MPRGEEEDIAERDELLLFELLLFVFFALVAARVFLAGPNLYPSLFRRQSRATTSPPSSSVGNARRRQALDDVITILQLH
ncbi:hypothetical protein AC630_03220 [Bradyrhizobium sp. AS23.2]|nr:hypothetical protein AC630_03220 [Bradyrhizobium sp. AS23.2]